MVFFAIIFGIDAVVASIALYFFAIGLGDGSVSSFNMLLWMEILGSVTAVLVGGLLLKSRGHPRWANAVLMILALPAFGYALFFLVLIISHPRWN
jgi:hypothetical protein